MVDIKDRRRMTVKGVNASIVSYVERSAEAVTVVWLQDTKNPFLLYASRDIEAGEELWASYGPMYWMGNLHDEAKYPTPMAKLVGCMITAYWTDYSPREKTDSDRVAALSQRSCATLTVGAESGGLSVHRLEFDPSTRAIRRRHTASSSRARISVEMAAWIGGGAW